MGRFIQAAACAVLLSAGLGCSKPGVEEVSPTGEITPVDAPSVTSGDWPWWRGYNRDGKTTDQSTYPLKWSETENVAWKVRVPGRGNSSPIVVGDRVFLTTAEKSRGVQSVLCYDRRDGRLRWRSDVHQGSLGEPGHTDNTHASASAACDGERVFAVFLFGKDVFVTALNLNGERLWQTHVGKNTSDWGLAASPTVYKELVLLSSDSAKDGFVAALNRRTGRIWWRKARSASDSYTSPVIAKISGRDQLLLAGGDHVIACDPMTGEQLWSKKCVTEVMCGTLAWDGNTVFASGGWPERVTVALNAGSDSAEVKWTNNTKIYVSSMLVHDGCLYGSYDAILHCLDTKTGKRNWKVRISADSYGSPVLAGGNLYIPTRDGKVHVFKPNAAKAEKLAVNTLGNAMDTTPTPNRGQLFLRVAQKDVGSHKEWLYCIGKKR